MIWDITNIEGFSKAEYMMAFFAILFGYITSEYFKGFGLLFRYLHKMQFPWSFLMYAGITFILITIY